VVRRYSPYRTEIARAVQSLNVKEGASAEKLVSLEGAAGSEEDAPIIQIVANTFKEAVLNKASDIHIEPQQTSLRIRFRIDGDLRQVASIAGQNLPSRSRPA
jgi:type II secretory ATPase GspE/PulE/Tfp pilus assembly ATPase PilB-like protein